MKDKDVTGPGEFWDEFMKSLSPHERAQLPEMGVERSDLFDSKGNPNIFAFINLCYEKWDFITPRDTEVLHIWDGTCYRPHAERWIKELMSAEFEAVGKKVTKYYVDAVTYHINARTGVDREKLNPSGYLNVKNGVLDLKTFQLYEHTPDMYFTYCIPVEYDPNVDTTPVEEYLRQIVREEDVPLLEEMMGYCLVEGNPYQKAFMLYGEGNNGKSIFLKILTEMLGKENVAHNTLQDLTEHRFAKADLFGKRANICADIPKKALKNTGHFKMLTGEDDVRAEQKFQEAFYFENPATPIFSANELPDVYDTTKAFWRRWILIRFPYSFDGREDRHIFEKLKAHLPAFLKVALRGLKRLEEQGHFSVSQSSKELMQQWLESANNVRYFARVRVEKVPGEYTTKEEVYDEYLQFCHEHDLQPRAKGQFTQSFAEIIKRTPVRKRISGRITWIWPDVRLREEGEKEEGETEQKSLFSDEEEGGEER